MFLIRDELREHLKNTPKVIVAQKPDVEPNKSSSSSSSSESSSSESDSSASDSDSSDSSSESSSEESDSSSTSSQSSASGTETRSCFFLTSMLLVVFISEEKI